MAGFEVIMYGRFWVIPEDFCAGINLRVTIDEERSEPQRSFEAYS